MGVLPRTNTKTSICVTANLQHENLNSPVEALIDNTINDDELHYNPYAGDEGSHELPSDLVKQPDFGLQPYNITLEKWMLKHEDQHFTSEFSIQSKDTIGWDCMMKRIAEYLPTVLQDNDVKFYMTRIDSLSHIAHWARRCVDVTDYMALAHLSYRLWYDKAISVTIMERIQAAESEVQSFDSVEETVKTLKNLFKGVEAVGEHPLAKKMVSLYSYLLTQGFLNRMGLELNDEEYSRIEQRAFHMNYSSKKGFFLCIADFSLFIMERGLEWKKTGEFSSFLQNETEYTKWLKESDRILNLAPFTSNLTAHKTSYFSFVSDLKHAIELGESYCKFAKGSTGLESVYMVKKLNALKMLDNTEITRRAAQQERAAPMGVLVHGSSSIAKSAFAKMLFSYYGSLFDLETADEFRYVRNPMDEYWSNFNSSKWCIQFDELAFLNPVKSNDVDATLKDMLNVVNNVPYVPPQASLEDKGKTPVMAKLVIGTTNCIHLNAHEYFQCPLAIRRRLPYVVNLKPKREFIHHNGVFIDPLKIQIEDGKYPDLWTIQIMKIEPVIENGKELVKLTLVKEMNDVGEFLQDFGKECLAHEANQKRAMSTDVDMKTITVCKSCLKPLPHEECLSVQYADRALAGFYTNVMYFLSKVYEMWLCQRWVWAIFCFGARYRATRYIGAAMANHLMPQHLSVRYFGMAAEAIRSPRFRGFCLALTALSVTLGMYYGYRRRIEEPEMEKHSEAVKPKAYTVAAPNSADMDIKNEHIECLPQGGTSSAIDPEEIFIREASQNVWYEPNVELAPFDLPKASQSLVGATPSQIRDMLQNNCVYLEIRHGGDTKRVMRGFYVAGQAIMTNAHAFRQGVDDFTVAVCRTSTAKTLGGNYQFPIKRAQIAFHPYKDLCMFQVLNMPPSKNIQKFMSFNDSLCVTSGYTFRRECDGSINLDMVHGITLHEKLPVADLQMSLNIYIGTMSRATEEGMCGSVFIADTPRGPTISGIHVMGNGVRVGFMSVCLEDINILKDSGKFPFSMLIQGGGVPKLEVPGLIKTLGSIHHKSNFRYIEEGSGNVYGTINGFRPRPRSRVMETPLCDQFLEHYGRDEVEYGKPAMNSWEPWQRNLRPMFKRDACFDSEILHECAMSYFQDVVDELPEGWKKEVISLSTESAINGIPGVKFIDRINASSSMGFPWATSKKKYLIDAKSDKHPDGIDFVPDIHDLINKIEKEMQEGERSYPVFTGHLKDEATPLEKCRIQKTRVFTAAPLPHTIAVRKKLLTVIRLIQKNPFVFECLAGTVVQSTAWTNLADYLTKFGMDTMIAGDFSAYDKNMEAQVILLAYYVLYKLVLEAGWEQDDARCVLAIGYDTAFSFCNFNGDLVEFFGTNPSGHALTVIVNSIVNSIYTRYCYRVLNPAQEVRSFKQNVALGTYGDDNEMGVSPRCPWFNHCSISQVYDSVGIKYTMADKEAESVPYIHFSQTSFLKRMWVWDEDINAYMAPLDEESIVKSLTMWVPSTSIDKYRQMVAVISSACSEYFFHGKEKFEEKRAFFAGLLLQEPYLHYVQESTLPTYDQLVQRFQRASELL